MNMFSSVPEAVCSEGEYGQFPFRLLDWFLLLSRMGDPGSNNTSSIPSTPLPQSCLSREQRRRLAEVHRDTESPLEQCRDTCERQWG